MRLLVILVLSLIFIPSSKASQTCIEIFHSGPQEIKSNQIFLKVTERASQNPNPTLSILISKTVESKLIALEYEQRKEQFDFLSTEHEIQELLTANVGLEKSILVVVDPTKLDMVIHLLNELPNNDIVVEAIYFDETLQEAFVDSAAAKYVIREGVRRLEFEEAQKIVSMQGFTSRTQFREWTDRPNTIPSKPDVVYANKGWQGWAHFLGYPAPAKIKPYSEVQAVVSQQGFLFREDYRAWVDRPEGFPVDPESTYKNKGWQGWEHFLGFVRYARYNIKPYSEVQAVVATMGFSSVLDYKAWKDRPEGFPFSPYDVYHNHGWQSWQHFLGHKLRTKPKPYAHAQSLVSKWGFADREEYRAWKNRPEGIPAKPDVVYKNKGWQGWVHFLTPQNVKSFKDARELARQQGFSRIKEFKYWVYKFKPEGIPIEPDRVYKNSGWLGWADFLGAAKWMTYDEAKKVLIEAGIQSRKDFLEWKDRPLRIPADPSTIYADFTTWASFLENPLLRISPYVIKILPYHEARAIVAFAGIKSSKQYRDWKKPEGIPYDPQRIYKGKGWVDWPTYLGLKEPELPMLLEAPQE